MPTATSESIAGSSPYARLASLIEEYRRQATVEAVDELESLLARYGPLEFFKGQRDEQIRSFCELACTNYPLEIVEKFDDDFLRDVEREYMKEERRPYGVRPSRERRTEKIMAWLGFEQFVPSIGGLQLYTSELEESKEILSKERPTGREVDECGNNAFNNTVAVLKKMVSFYGRHLFGNENEDYMERLISTLALNDRNAPKALDLRRSRSQDWRLDLSTYVRLIEKINEFLGTEAGRDYGDKCEQDFGHRQLLLKESLDLLDQVVPERRYFAHEDDLTRPLPSKEKKERAERVIECLRLVAVNLQAFFPSVIMMRRKLLNERGEMRLDYVDESGHLQYDRFIRDFVPFFPDQEVYYWKRGRPEEGIFLQAPVCMPVRETG